MMTAKEANALIKRNVIREKILVEIEKEIVEICSVDGYRLAFPVNEKDEEWLKERLISFGYKILPKDSDIEGNHIIIDWSEEE